MWGIALAGRIFQRLQQRYILAMLLATRLCGSVGALLVVYYYDLIVRPEPIIRHHFHITSLIVVAIALVLTVWLGMWELRHLRELLGRLDAGQPAGDIDPTLAERAGREAVLFPSRHHKIEPILVFVITVLPVAVALKIIDDISLREMLNIAVSVFLALVMTELCTFLSIEKLLQPVIRHLLDCGIDIDYDRMPVGGMRTRLNVSFSLIILVTAMMIGTLAGQRATDIIRHPERQEQEVANLRAHATYITIAAVIVGLLFSSAMAGSVSSRVDHLVHAMRRVGAGSLNERLRPTGNDDIDLLARQFNVMVAQLKQNDQTIRELNATLEHKVQQRTEQLSQSKQELQHSLQQLQEHDRLKTEFFANVSHELRTPLTMIVAPVEQMLEQHGDALPAPVHSMLDVVGINGRRLLELINRLLEFSKLEAGQAVLHYAAVDLNDLIEQLINVARPLAEQRDVRLVVVPQTLPVLRGDADKLEIIFTNLLSNALKFTPAGGQVTVRLEHAGERLKLHVQDTGVGIAAADQSRIFERFVQIDGSTSRQFAGTGLGLPLAKEFVELHGGTLNVDSEPGRGSCFTVDLPLVEPAEDDITVTKGSDRAGRFSDLMICEFKAETTAETMRSAAPATAPRVLVVDDTPEVRRLVGDILGEQYQVLFANDGGEGFEVARRELPDLIVSDVMMPKVDGYEFCRRMQDSPETAEIPFIMLTARAEMRMKMEGLQGGAIDYVTKPFNAGELRVRVANLLKLRLLNQKLDERNRQLQQALDELQEAQSQLVHAEKMSSLGQLAAGLAHEINNAINAVYNGVKPLRQKTQQLQQMLQQHADASSQAGRPLPPELDQVLDRILLLSRIIEEGAARTARIVSDLKTFSHPGREAPSQFDLNECLDMCLNLLAHKLRDRIRVHRDYARDASICGPRGQLGQVFMNVLTNAQQAMEGHGELHITTCRQRQGVTVRIRDTGCGMPDHIKAKIFDPFFTTKDPGIGTGLGLSISYGLVTKLGGSIECHSEPNQGTEFVIHLPQGGALPPLNYEASAASTATPIA